MLEFLSSMLTLLIIAAVFVWLAKQYCLVRILAAKIPKRKTKRRKRIVYDDDLND